MDVGGRLIASLIRDNSTYEYLKLKLFEDLFKGEEKLLFDMVDKHVGKFHALPSEDLIVSNGFEMPVAKDGVSYYMEETTNRYLYDVLNAGFGDASSLMVSKDLTGSVSRLIKTLDEVTLINKRLNLANLGKEGWDIYHNDYVTNNKQDTNTKINLGWDYLDEMTGGLVGGDVVSYIGRPAMGKTWQLLFSAQSVWKTSPQAVMVVSMEMAVLPIVHRMASLMSSVPMNHVKGGNLTEKEMKKVKSVMQAATKVATNFWVVDGNLTSTPQDIFSLARQLGVKTLFIDGAYLLKHTNPKMDRFTKVAENIEYIKHKAAELDMVVICSYQFSRNAVKKKKDETVGLEDIAYSDAIGQISSVVLGLLEDDGVETLHRRKVSVLKGRNGETGHFYIKWDFKTMDFTQCQEEEEVKSPIAYV